LVKWHIYIASQKKKEKKEINITNQNNI